MVKKFFLQVPILVLLTLAAAACGLSQAELDARDTQASLDISGTQTAQIRTATQTFTPSPTTANTPTITASPTVTPTPTRTATATPTPTPQWMDAGLALDDLPAGFREMTVQELSPLTKNLPQNSLAFGFSNDGSVQIVMGYLISYPSPAEQIAFDRLIPDMLELFASAYGATTAPEAIEGLDGVGKTRRGSTFLAEGGEIDLRWENILFRRGEIGAFLFVVSPKGEEPARSAGDLARLLDERLGEALDIAGCLKPGVSDGNPDLTGKIAFVSDRDGNPEIYAINADGTGERRLTNHPGNDFAPAWSPDGSKIAFYSERDGNAEIYVMNADGSGVINLTNNPAADYAPAWSPDGERIAFHSHRFLGSGRIFVMNADGSGVLRLTDPSFDDWSPVWSPDGKQIVFNSSRGPKLDIWLMNADGSGMKNLTNYPADDWWPNWSPDGQQIAFHSARDNNFEIYTINIDGTGATRLTDHPAGDYDPSWGPNGAQIAFTSDRCGDREIWLIRADGSEATNLTFHPANDWAPAWYGPRTTLPPKEGSQSGGVTSTWRDDFEAELSEPWEWTNENPTQWNLTEKPGYLRIYASPYGTADENLLLRPVEAGDFTIETRLLFEPDTNYQMAGLVIYQDDKNFLKLGRAYCDNPDTCAGNGIYFDSVLGGNLVSTNFATKVDTSKEAYLRLVRIGDMLMAYYSPDGEEWQEIGFHQLPADFQVKGAGLTSAQDFNTPGRRIPADFDYFVLTEGG
jgi:Tol biopolymer transport system component/regulation of enolase protein 1 (concanavalin A-like superfamily)